MRLLDLGGVHNVRDLGGYARARGGVTAWGRVFRGDALQGLDDTGIERLVATGLRTVIDLRTDDELRQEPPRLAGRPGIRWHHLSLYSGLQPIGRDGIAADFSMTDRYIMAFDRCGQNFVRVFAVLAEAPGTVLFHCTAGKDRTGLVAALLLDLAGVSEDDIIADYALTETLGAGLIARLRAGYAGADLPRTNELLAARAGFLRPVLRRLVEQGGASVYLAEQGLGIDRIDGLRRMLDRETGDPSPGCASD